MRTHENTCKLVSFRYPLVFLQACRKGDLRLVKSLIRNHLSFVEKIVTRAHELDILEIRDLKGAGVFHYAAQGNQIPILRFFHPFVLNVPAPRATDWTTPAHDAAALGHLKALQWMLRNTACRLLDQDHHGCNILHTAAKQLDVRSLRAATLVNRKWLRIIKSDRVLRKRLRESKRSYWKSVAQRGFIEPAKLPAHLRANFAQFAPKQPVAVRPTPIVFQPQVLRSQPAVLLETRKKRSIGPVKSALKASVKQINNVLGSRPSRMRF